MRIKLQFIQSYSTEKLQKTFYSRQILDHYQHTNNRKNRQLKESIQDYFQQALKYKIIKSDCQLEFKNKKIKTQPIQVQKLTPLLIGQSEKIYFSEVLF